MTAHESFIYRTDQHISVLRSGRRRRGYNAAKRLLDILLVLATAPLTVPAVAVLALLVRRDGSPAFYRQPRLGRGYDTFGMWKLRTMVQDSDRALAEYLDRNPAAAREWNETQKLRRDPRVTPIGRFIRRHSLDELPQLWNVLIGDMSIVGPRPMMPDQLSLYPGEAYFSMRPGLTGLWQIGARNGTTFADRAAYDNRYAEINSVRVDLTIMLMTVAVVFRGTGV